MKITFGQLQFEIENERIYLLSSQNKKSNFVEVQVCGENKDTHMGVKMANSSEGARLRFVSHTQLEDYLEIVQQSDLVEVKTVFNAYSNGSFMRIYTEVKNVADKEIVLEEVSSFVLTGFSENGIDGAEDLYFTRFIQSHHAECQPRKFSFKDLGLFCANNESQKRIAFANIGSWSTKEELPP